MNYIVQEMPKAGDTVVVGMSGGVDSTLVALLLKEKGCRVIGVTMSLWDGSLPEIKSDKPLKEACYGPGEEENIEDCEKFCSEHGIEYHVIEVKEEYKQKVLEYFKAEYRAGRTPNPCIQCNRYIKFGALLDGISNISIKYDYFCTGHYAKIVRPESGIFSSRRRTSRMTASPARSSNAFPVIRLFKRSAQVCRKTALSPMRTRSRALSASRPISIAISSAEREPDFDSF